MGLGYIELIMRVEEEFGVEIPDAEACQLVTVGALYEALARRLCVKRTEGCVERPKGCASQAWFYTVRRALRQEFAVERALVIPDMYLDLLLPREQRRAAWLCLAEALQVTLPPLQLRQPTRRELALTGTATAGLLFGWLLHPLGWAAAAAGALALAVDARDGAAVRDEPPFNTARDLVAYLTRTMTPKSCRCWSRPELWSALVPLIEEQLGLYRSQIVPEARWVDDLHVG